MLRTGPTTFSLETLESDAKAKQFRNQATGIGQTRLASERTGARRSQCVADAVPSMMRDCMDRSYPAPVAGGPTDCATGSGSVLVQTTLR